MTAVARPIAVPELTIEPSASTNARRPPSDKAAWVWNVYGLPPLNAGSTAPVLASKRTT